VAEQVLPGLDARGNCEVDEPAVRDHAVDGPRLGGHVEPVLVDLRAGGQRWARWPGALRPPLRTLNHASPVTFRSVALWTLAMYDVIGPLWFVSIGSSGSPGIAPTMVWCHCAVNVELRGALSGRRRR
jgi:hypothetical protein